MTAPRARPVVERSGYAVAVRYVGSPQPWLDLLAGLVVRHVPGDGGGTLLVWRCAEAGRRLRVGPAPARSGRPAEQRTDGATQDTSSTPIARAANGEGP